MKTKDSFNDNISSSQMIILQSPKVTATFTIMIITATIIITIITTKISNSCNINNIDFGKIGHHLVLHSKSAPAINMKAGVLPMDINFPMCSYQTKIVVTRSGDNLNGHPFCNIKVKWTRNIAQKLFLSRSFSFACGNLPYIMQ